MKGAKQEIKESTGKCSKCHKIYPKSSLEKVGEKEVCFKCLEKIVKKEMDKSKYNPYKALNIYLLISIFSFFLIALNILFLSFPLMAEAFNDLYSPAAHTYLILMGKFVLVFIEITLLYISSSLAFMLGILILLGLIISPFFGVSAPNIDANLIIFHIIIPLVGMFGLFIGKKGLYNKN
ncbi:MAG: hypothetical protein WC356_00685 [Candidatus Micrarchaeia archaeon]